MADSKERQVVLKNLGSIPFQADLYHHLVCARRSRCTCKVDYPHGPKGKPRHLPASFRIEPGKESKPLPLDVLRIPQVKTAQKRGTLKLLSDKAQVEKI
jgi:hypothetical protein